MNLLFNIKQKIVSLVGVFLIIGVGWMINLFNLEAHAQVKDQLGWSNEKMPAGMRKSEKPSEYVWEKDGTIMIYIPAGKFTMGRDWLLVNEKPVHTIELSAFYIDKLEITRGTFKKFIESARFKTTAEREGNATVFRPEKIEVLAGKSWRDPGFPQDDFHPVVMVSWNDAKAYAAWSGKALPTEAQWEKAASWDEKASEGNKKRKHPWGNVDAAGPNTGTANLRKLGNFADVSFAQQMPDNETKKYLLNTQWGGQYDDGYVYTSPAGSFTLGASPYGLLDMTGNVWEWCEDGYGEDFYNRSPAVNPVNNDGQKGRVIRGPGYDIPCTNPWPSSYRTFSPADFRISTIGFRTVVPAP